MPGIFSGPAEDKAVRDLFFITRVRRAGQHDDIPGEREHACIPLSGNCKPGNNRKKELHCLILIKHCLKKNKKKCNTFYFCLNVCVVAFRNYAHCSHYSQKQYQWS